MLEGEQLRPLPANWTQLLADEVERLADVKELINRLDPHQQKLMLGRMVFE
jgi:transposase